jgi:hypothetical protein
MSARNGFRRSSRFASREPWQGTYDFIGLPSYVPGPRGLPLLKPPFGSIVAIDMNSGEHRWRIPVGRSTAMSPIGRLASPNNWDCHAGSWTLVTKTVMVVVQMGYLGPMHFVPGLNMPIRELFNLDPHLWVYDKTTGEMLAEMALPANATGAPMTVYGRRQAVHRVSGRRRENSGGTDRGCRCNSIRIRVRYISGMAHAHHHDHSHAHDHAWHSRAPRISVGRLPSAPRSMPASSSPN